LGFYSSAITMVHRPINIRIGYFFENRLHWQFGVRLLLFTVGIYV